MDNQLEDQMAFIPHLYPGPGVYTQLVVPLPPQETKPPRRRRKKSKGETGLLGKKKRKLSQEQVTLLEKNFGHEHNLESKRKDQIASELGLDPRQVAVWFQNRRARWKNKKIEEEYSKLKSLHESAVLDNSCLQSEVIKVKVKLSEAEKEIQRLSSLSSPASSSVDQSHRGGEGVSMCSTVSMAMGACPPIISLFGEFEYEDNILFHNMASAAGAEESYNIMHGIDWLN